MSFQLASRGLIGLLGNVFLLWMTFSVIPTLYLAVLISCPVCPMYFKLITLWLNRTAVSILIDVCVSQCVSIPFPPPYSSSPDPSYTNVYVLVDVVSLLQ